MNKKRFFLFLIILLFIIAGVYLFILKLHPASSFTLSLINSQPVSIPNFNAFHFYSGGFALTGDSTLFFDFEGNRIDPPLDANILPSEDQDMQVNKSTYNYMLVNNDLVYNTSVLPFEPVYTFEEGSGLGINEYKDFLLLSAFTDKERITAFSFCLEDKKIYNYPEIEGFHYLDCDYEQSTQTLTILALDTQGPFPTSRIFHYKYLNNLYGVTSFEDRFFYKVFRISSQVILVGNHKLLCYNIDGTMEWSLDISSVLSRQYLVTDEGILFYFDNYVFEQSNVLFIDNNCNKTYMSFPQKLKHLKKHDKGYIAVNHGRYVVFLDKRGNIIHSHELDFVVSELHWTDRKANYFYVLDKENNVFIYSLNPEAEGK